MVSSGEEAIFVDKLSNLINLCSKRIFLKIPDKSRYLLVYIVNFRLVNEKILISVFGTDIGDKVA